jgi:hypothetical protein
MPKTMTVFTKSLDIRGRIICTVVVNMVAVQIVTAAAGFAMGFEVLAIFWSACFCLTISFCNYPAIPRAVSSQAKCLHVFESSIISAALKLVLALLTSFDPRTGNDRRSACPGTPCTFLVGARWDRFTTRVVRWNRMMAPNTILGHLRSPLSANYTTFMWFLMRLT